MCYSEYKQNTTSACRTLLSALDKQKQRSNRDKGNTNGEQRVRLQTIKQRTPISEINEENLLSAWIWDAAGSVCVLVCELHSSDHRGFSVIFSVQQRYWNLERFLCSTAARSSPVLPSIVFTSVMKLLGGTPIQAAVFQQVIYFILQSGLTTFFCLFWAEQMKQHETKLDRISISLGSCCHTGVLPGPDTSAATAFPDISCFWSPHTVQCTIYNEHGLLSLNCNLVCESLEKLFLYAWCHLYVNCMRKRH